MLKTLYLFTHPNHGCQHNPLLSFPLDKHLPTCVNNEIQWRKQWSPLSTQPTFVPPPRETPASLRQ